MSETFYTYLWLREFWSHDGRWAPGTPYYAGKGKNGRAFQKHDRFHPPKNREFILIQEFPDESSAFDGEKLLIRLYGRADQGTGCLRNMTDGGEGASNPSAEVRAKMAENGKIQGDKNVTNGHLASIQSMAGKIGGSISGAKHRESGHIIALGHKFGPICGPENLKKMTAEQRQKAGSKGGSISGPINIKKISKEAMLRGARKVGQQSVENGRLASYRTPEHQSEAGKRGGRVKSEAKLAACRANFKIASCLRYNIRRGKPCTCGKHIIPVFPQEAV